MVVVLPRKFCGDDICVNGELCTETLLLAEVHAGVTLIEFLGEILGLGTAGAGFQIPW